jgi:hypothetical protein
VTTHSALDSEPGTPSGLGLNVKLDPFGRLHAKDGPSPAPSLITLHSSLPASPDPTTPSTEEGEPEFSPDPADDAPTMRRRKVPSPTMAMTTLANGTATQTAKKPKKKTSRHKSPLLDALKLPQLTELSIPKPVQIK